MSRSNQQVELRNKCYSYKRGIYVLCSGVVTLLTWEQFGASSQISADLGKFHEVGQIKCYSCTVLHIVGDLDLVFRSQSSVGTKHMQLVTMATALARSTYISLYNTGLT